MTLAKAVEALKDALENRSCYCSPCVNCKKRDKAIASLPEPKSDDEILKLMYDGIPPHWQSPMALSCMKHGLIALKSAGVLYCKDEKS